MMTLASTLLIKESGKASAWGHDDLRIRRFIDAMALF
jgi:hypothetical protein